MVQSPGFQFEDNAERVGLMGLEGGVTESDARIKSRLTWEQGTGRSEGTQWPAPINHAGLGRTLL